MAGVGTVLVDLLRRRGLLGRRSGLAAMGYACPLRRPVPPEPACLPSLTSSATTNGSLQILFRGRGWPYGFVPALARPRRLARSGAQKGFAVSAIDIKRPRESWIETKKGRGSRTRTSSPSVRSCSHFEASSTRHASTSRGSSRRRRTSTNRESDKPRRAHAVRQVRVGDEKNGVVPVLDVTKIVAWMRAAISVHPRLVRAARQVSAGQRWGSTSYPRPANAPSPTKERSLFARSSRPFWAPSAPETAYARGLTLSGLKTSDKMDNLDKDDRRAPLRDRRLPWSQFFDKRSRCQRRFWHHDFGPLPQLTDREPRAIGRAWLFASPDTTSPGVVPRLSHQDRAWHRRCACARRRYPFSRVRLSSRSDRLPSPSCPRAHRVSAGLPPSRSRLIPSRRAVLAQGSPLFWRNSCVATACDELEPLSRSGRDLEVSARSRRDGTSCPTDARPVRGSHRTSSISVPSIACDVGPLRGGVEKKTAAARTKRPSSSATTTAHTDHTTRSRLTDGLVTPTPRISPTRTWRSTPTRRFHAHDPVAPPMAPTSTAR